MTPARLLTALRARGVRLEAAGNRLRWQAPHGVVTDDDLVALRAAKPVLLKILAIEAEPPIAQLERDWRAVYARARELVTAAGMDSDPAEIEATARVLLEPATRPAPLAHGPLRSEWLRRCGELETCGYPKALAERRAADELGLLMRLPRPERST